MRVSHWLCPLAARLNAVRKRQARPRPTARLWLEALEDRCLPSVTINEFPFPSSHPNGIKAGPDGNVWFTEAGNGKVLGRITPTGQITEVGFASLPENIASFAFGNDGNIWSGGGTYISEATPQGVLLHAYQIPSTLATFYHPSTSVWVPTATSGTAKVMQRAK
jgi:virginiamycin B lyase